MNIKTTTTLGLSLAARPERRSLRGRRRRRRRLGAPPAPPARSSLAVEQPRGDRLGQGRWSRRGTPSTPTRRSPPRRSRPARPPRRSSAPRSPPATRRAWSSTPRPAAVPQFQKQGGLVALDDFDGGTDYIEERTGDAAEQYQSPDGKFYQIPWKSNPVMIFYNKDFEEGRGRPGEPAAGDLRRVPRHQQEDRRQRCRRGRDLARADQRVLPVLVRLLPAVRRRDRRHAARRGRQGDLRRRRPARPSRTSGRRCTTRALARRRSTTATPSPTRRPRWRSSARGRSRSTARRSTGAPSRSRPRPAPRPEETYTFSDAKNIGLYSACENQGTAWEVLKFATSEEQDGKLLEMTGQMPMRERPGRRPTRTTSRRNPDYETFADQAVAHRRGAQRAELDRDLADVPRRVLVRR